MTAPAERWHLAAASMVAARRYAADVAGALGAARNSTVPGPVARLRRSTRIHRRVRRPASR